MTRRQVLKQLAVLLGGAVSNPVVAAVMSDSRRDSSSDAWQPRTLSGEQDRLVTAVAEVILPATDTPGAAVAGVNQFIDLVLTEWLGDEDRDRFLTGLADLEVSCRAQFDRSFLDLTSEEWMAVLVPLDREAVEARVKAAKAGSVKITDQPFFGMMKEMTLVGYYTSEIGMTQELRYEEYPGSWKGCIPFDEVGRTWA
jgi:hypothetical protein